jgi:hypothetical protein
MYQKAQKVASFFILFKEFLLKPWSLTSMVFIRDAGTFPGSDTWIQDTYGRRFT